MGIIHRVDHVAIGVNDIEKAAAFMLDVLGAEQLKGPKTNEREGFVFHQFTLAGSKMELVAPVVAGEGGVGRYLSKAGEGLHHLSVSVENAQEAIKHFESKGIRVLGTRDDKSSWRHFYLHPQDTFGASIQVFERRPKAGTAPSVAKLDD